MFDLKKVSFFIINSFTNKYFKWKHEADSYLIAVCCLLSIIRRHMFVPGHVENWNVVIETKNMSLWSLSSYTDVLINFSFSHFFFL